MKAVGSVPHQPVLLEEVIHYLNVVPDGIYLDATVGAGGHAAAVAERLADGRLIGLDRDESALSIAAANLQRFGDRVRLEHSAFSRFSEVLDRLQIERVDGVLADLGVSSMQLDDPLRGFSFRSDAPPDMRMDRSKGETAEAFLARVPEKELIRIIGEYGEERFAGRIARRIVRERDAGFQFTGESLRRLVHESIPAKARYSGIDPATRTFQAIRIALNRELEELEMFLGEIRKRMKPGGRIVVISFHSLEDGIVKRRFRDWASPPAGPKGLPVRNRTVDPEARVLTRKPVRPSEAEEAGNPRSRSARLRAIEILKAME